MQDRQVPPQRRFNPLSRGAGLFGLPMGSSLKIDDAHPTEGRQKRRERSHLKLATRVKLPHASVHAKATKINLPAAAAVILA
jgi:hypothetical protein